MSPIIRFKQQATCHCYHLLLVLIFLVVSCTFAHNSNNAPPPSNHHRHHSDAGNHHGDADNHHHQSYNNNNNNHRNGRQFNPKMHHQPDSSSDQDSTVDEPDVKYNPPYDLKAIRLSNTSLVLLWDIESLALEHTEYFLVQYKSKKSTEWTTDNNKIPSSSKAFQIDHLKPGEWIFVVMAVFDDQSDGGSEEYKFRLRANSKISKNEYPEMKAPEIFWTESHSDCLRFKWLYKPLDKDYEWFGFLFYYRSAHAVGDFYIYNCYDESAEIAELEPDTPYEVKVVAYNNVTVGEFSKSMTISTRPKNETIPTTQTHIPPDKLPTTTPMPQTSEASEEDEIVSSTITFSQATSTTLWPTQAISTKVPSLKPTTSPTNKPTISTTPNSSGGDSNAKTSFYDYVSSIVDQILGKQTDAIKLPLIILLLVLLVVLATLYLLSFFRRPNKTSPPSSTHESMQFDLEINGYFKNSFPGVENVYTPNHHHVHLGFVNNHPHINDFA